MATHICLRHSGEEDWRFKAIRDKIGESSCFALHAKLFLQLFFPQYITVMIMQSASLYVGIYTSETKLVWTDYLGLAVFLIGFLIEIVADH